MTGESKGQCCAQGRCGVGAVTEIETLMFAFLDCDVGGSGFGEEEACTLRGALRNDRDAVQLLFDLLVQDMLLADIHSRYEAD